MKKVRLTVCSLLLLAAAGGLAWGQAERVVVQPKDTGGALINPGMGWMFHHYDNSLTTYTVDLAPYGHGAGVSRREFGLYAPGLVRPRARGRKVQLVHRRHAHAEVGGGGQDHRLPVLHVGGLSGERPTPRRAGWRKRAPKATT